jgi:hypothetical protein
MLMAANLLRLEKLLPGVMMAARAGVIGAS